MQCQGKMSIAHQIWAVSQLYYELVISLGYCCKIYLMTCNELVICTQRPIPIFHGKSIHLMYN